VKAEAAVNTTSKPGTTKRPISPPTKRKYKNKNSTVPTAPKNNAKFPSENRLFTTFLPHQNYCNNKLK
jgi:hypothetical protein